MDDDKYSKDHLTSAEDLEKESDVGFPIKPLDAVNNPIYDEKIMDNIKEYVRSLF